MKKEQVLLTLDAAPLSKWGERKGIKRKEKESALPAATLFGTTLAHMQVVLDLGAEKYGADSWKDRDNASLQHKANCASMFRHLAEVSVGTDKDHESGVDPLLHLICRAMMRYERKVRGIEDV